MWNYSLSYRPKPALIYLLVDVEWVDGGRGDLIIVESVKYYKYFEVDGYPVPGIDIMPYRLGRRDNGVIERSPLENAIRLAFATAEKDGYKIVHGGGKDKDGNPFIYI